MRGPVRHKQILRRNKDHKNQRDVLLQINITDRPWGGKAAFTTLGDLFKKKRERERERKKKKEREKEKEREKKERERKKRETL